MKFNLMSTACSIFYFLITLFKTVKPHSWAACTKYTATISGQDYDDSSCEGYTRNWGNVYSSSSSFGADVGADYQPGGTSASGTWCDQTLGTSSQDYGDTYPTGYEMATYTIGETIRIVWPAKNHANYECFGNIPDTGMKLFVNTNRNPTSDPQTLSDWTEVIDWHDGETPGTDGVPFQNCPKFCDNTDRAVCYGDVELDDDSLFSQGSGYYTFMWYWAFNNAQDIYTTCWEAYVETSSTGGTTNNNDDTTQSPDTNTPSPVDNNGGGDDDDDDTPTNTNTPSPVSNNGDDDDDSSEEDSLEYLIFIPVCIRGATYDKDLVLEGASNTISQLEWSIYSEKSDSSGFNVTIESHTDDSVYVVAATTSASNDDHTLCTNIIQVYDSNNPDEFILNCDSCTDVLVYRAVYNGDDDDSGEESNSTGGDSNTTTIIILSIVLTILLLCLIGGIIYYKCYYLKYNRRSNHYGSQDYGHKKSSRMGSKKNILAAAHTSSQQAISYVDDDKAGRPTLR